MNRSGLVRYGFAQIEQDDSGFHGLGKGDIVPEISFDYRTSRASIGAKPNPDSDAVPVKVFTFRNLCRIYTQIKKIYYSDWICLLTSEKIFTEKGVAKKSGKSAWDF